MRVWELLEAIRSKVGKDARQQISRAVGVGPRAVDLWYQQGQSVTVRPANVFALAKLARSLGIDTLQFEESPPLWRPDLPFESQFQYDPGPYPEHLTFKLHRVRALDRFFDSCFGSASGPIAQSAFQMYYLAKSGLAFVTTTSFLPYERRPNPPPNLLQYKNEIEPTAAFGSDDFPYVVLDDPNVDFRPTSGLAANCGLVSPQPPVWIQNIVDARRMIANDPDVNNVLLIASVAGFAGETRKQRGEILDGYESAVNLAANEAGAEVVEINVGSPSIARLLSSDVELIEEIAIRARRAAGDKKLILKLGVAANLDEIVLKAGPHVNAIAAINSVPVYGVRLDQEGQQYRAWNSGTAGLSGSPVLRTGLETCQNLVALLKKRPTELGHLTLIGIGGISSPEHILLYKEKVGVQLVASHTPFIEKPLFGIPVRQYLDKRLAVEVKSTSKRRENMAINWAIALEQEWQDVHPGDHRRLVQAASAVLADYLDSIDHVSGVATGKRASVTPTIDELRERIAKMFKGLGEGGKP